MCAMILWTKLVEFRVISFKNVVEGHVRVCKYLTGCHWSCGIAR